MKLSVNNISHSTINGPGNRLVIWVQGCPLHCPGCFNPSTHNIDDSKVITIDALVKIINTDSNIEGITISGGEPLMYPEALAMLLKKVNNKLTKIVYSGYTLEEILADKRKQYFLRWVDLAIVGRYDRKLKHPYLGKKFLNITGKIDLNEFSPQFKIEYAIENAQVTRTGIFKQN